MSNIKRKRFNMKGGIVYACKDVNTEFLQSFLDEMTEHFNNGHSVEDIAEAFGRDPDEVFLGLFHQARQGKTTRPFAYRK